MQKNESYPDIEKKYGVTARDIQSWNHLNQKTPLRNGQQLTLWKRSHVISTYTVKSGDNLSTIAQKNNTKTSLLIQLNPELTTHSLRPGQKITLG